MPMNNYKCNSCNDVKEMLVGSHVLTHPSEFKCICGGTYEIQFTPSNVSCDIIGGYAYTYGKKSKMNNTNHKADWLSNSNISPY